MSEYGFFATVYDRMMENIPYEMWELYLLQIMYKKGVSPDATITELGCGTGVMTRKLAEDGFRMTGVDLSEDMLRVAKSKNSDTSNDGISDDSIKYIQMDMRELKLDEKQDVIISICDSVNYLLTNEDLLRMMKGVYDNLKDGGVFIFDLKTEYFFKNALDGRTFKENLGDFSYVWKNHYDEGARIHAYDLRFECKASGRKNKKTTGKQVFEETHKQRVFNASDIKEAAERAGFTKASVYGEMSFEKPRKNSERIYIVMVK